MAATDREALLFAFRGDRMLVREGKKGGLPVPLVRSPEELGLAPIFRQEIGSLNGRRCVAAEVGPEAEAPEGMGFRDLRAMLGWAGADEAAFVMAGRAKQVVDWNRTHRYCGRCGSETGPHKREPLARVCPNCGMVFYPRISPAAIVLVRRGEEVLLARSPQFPKGMYSALAGFVEPGETLEECVRREVGEEVGISLGEVRYFASQPWPFPNSLMVGFVAEYAGGDLAPDPEEIEDAGWFRPDALPGLPPQPSIARAMIDAFVSASG
jgi:NAD+ diphosphatase